MSTLLIPAGRSLIDELRNRLEREGHDYSSGMVVFPGKRPGHFLRKTLAEDVVSGFIPPSILSMDEFVDVLSIDLLPGRRLDSIDAVALLFEIHKASVHPLGGEGFLSPDSFFPIGLKIYRDLEELYIEGIHPESVKGIESLTAGNIPEHTLQRLQTVSYFYEEFYLKVFEMGFSTRALRYRTVAERFESVKLSGFRQVIFAGFFALTRSEKDLFKKMQKVPGCLWIFQNGPGMREKLAELNVREETEEEEPAEPRVCFYSSPDTHGQVFALSRVLDDEKSGNNNNTVIVLPTSETLFPLLRHGLAGLHEDNYNISMGYPLLRTPIFSFLNDLMEVVASMDEDRVYVPAYLKFVLHPYTKNIYCEGSAELTRIMFHTIEERLTEGSAKMFISLAEIEGDTMTLRTIHEKVSIPESVISETAIRAHLKEVHRNTFGMLLTIENVGSFAARCEGVLAYIFQNSTARFHPLFQPFAEAFIKSFGLISRSLMKEIVFGERTSYFSFLKRFLLTCHLPFDGTPLRGLQVLGFLETRNLRFDRVYVLDANEEIIPDTKKEDSLLPFKAREILGLPTYLDRDRLTAYYFSLLLKGAREVHLFFVEDDKRERSRFVEKLLWERQKRDKATDSKRYLQSVQYRLSLANFSPDSLPKDAAVVDFLRQFSFSATSLNTYLSCRLKFYYTYVLGMGRKNDLTGDIERTDIGKVVHEALSTYFRKRKGRILAPDDIDMDEAVDIVFRLFERDFGDNPSGQVYLLRRQIERRIRDLFEKYYLPLIRELPFSVVEVEKSIGIMHGPFRLKGRLDCLEQRGLKKVIIDYKTSANSSYLKIDFDSLDPADRGTWDSSINSLQLPFYILLYSAFSGIPKGELEGMFLLLGRAEINRDIEVKLFDDGFEVKEGFKILETVITGLLHEIADPFVPFLPAADKKKTCPACDFRYICGTQWLVKSVRG